VSERDPKMIYPTPINGENHPITGKNSLNNRTKEHDLIHRIVSTLSVEQLTVFGSFVLSQPFLVFVELFLFGLQKKIRKNREGWCM